MGRWTSGHRSPCTRTALRERQLCPSSSSVVLSSLAYPCVRLCFLRLVRRRRHGGGRRRRRRQLTGDVYFGTPKGIDTLPSGERVGYNNMIYSESEIERIARVAFDVARKRGSKVCSVDKANVLDCSQVIIVTRVVLARRALSPPKFKLRNHRTSLFRLPLLAALARGRDRAAQQGVLGRRALAHVRRQRRDAAHPLAQAVRRHRDGQHIRRHSLGRGA